MNHTEHSTKQYTNTQKCTPKQKKITHKTPQKNKDKKTRNKNTGMWV